MRQITVIFTRHKECGNCNSSQLLSILEIIRPTIIFEELSLENFEKAYIQKDLATLETDTIKRYLIDKEIQHLPVDTYPRTREHDESIDRLYARINGGITQDVFDYRGIVNQLHNLEMHYGFSFLNSSQNDQLFDELDKVKTKILDYLNDERLFEIHKEEIKMMNNRENEILKNIYAFAKNNSFEEAVMFIGSGHRRSIFPLIEKFQEKEEIEIIWKNYLQ